MCSERFCSPGPCPALLFRDPFRPSSPPWASPPFLVLLAGDLVCLRTQDRPGNLSLPAGRQTDSRPVPSVLCSVVTARRGPDPAPRSVLAQPDLRSVASPVGMQRGQALAFQMVRGPCCGAAAWPDALLPSHLLEVITDTPGLPTLASAKQPLPTAPLPSAASTSPRIPSPSLQTLALSAISWVDLLLPERLSSLSPVLLRPPPPPPLPLHALLGCLTHGVTSVTVQTGNFQVHIQLAQDV